MKYLKKFETEADKNAWLAGSEFVTPNVVLTEGKVGYNLEIDHSLLPLHIQAIGNLTITFSNNYEYSKDNTTWSSGTSSTSISASAGEKVYFRASGLTPSTSSGIGKFTISGGTCNVAGNVMSMAYGADFSDKTNIPNEYQFRTLFLNANIIDASKMVLPATTLAGSCYDSMFKGCTKLVNAPELPATKIERSCYNSMFYNCMNLVIAPALPATTLMDYCYNSMFYNCAKLVNAPELPATSLMDYCYNSMFRGCAKLVNAPELPATSLGRYCYDSMFYGCTSLVNAPALPATSLTGKGFCYQSMFYGCTKLNYIKAMFTTTPSDSFTKNWVYGVSSIGTFVKNSAATWDVTGVNGIPEGWTVETATE